MSAVDRDEETTGDRLDQRQRTVLMLLFSDPSPWTVQELGRELHGEQLAEDAGPRTRRGGARSSPCRRFRSPDSGSPPSRRSVRRGPDNDETIKRRAALEERLRRMRDPYELGDLQRSEYLTRRDAINAELDALAPEPIPDLDFARSVLEDFTAF